MVFDKQVDGSRSHRYIIFLNVKDSVFGNVYLTDAEYEFVKFISNPSNWITPSSTGDDIPSLKLFRSDCTINSTKVRINRTRKYKTYSGVFINNIKRIPFKIKVFENDTLFDIAQYVGASTDGAWLVNGSPHKATEKLWNISDNKEEIFIAVINKCPNV